MQFRVPAGAITRGPTRPAGDGTVIDEPTFLDPKLHDFGLRAVASTGAPLHAIAELDAKEVHPHDRGVLRCYPVKYGSHASQAGRHRRHRGSIQDEPRAVGVSWLHLRLDSRPKYVKWAAYR